MSDAFGPSVTDASSEIFSVEPWPTRSYSEGSQTKKRAEVCQITQEILAYGVMHPNLKSVVPVVFNKYASVRSTTVGVYSHL